MAKEISTDKIRLTEGIKKAVGKETKKESESKKKKMKVASQLKASYCRYCNKLLDYKEFQSTTNPFIDKNGCLSICTKCLEKIFNELYHTYDDYNKAFYAFCQHADIMYDEVCVNEALNYLREHPNGENIITKYWRAVRNNNREKPIRYRDTKTNNLIENSLNKGYTDKERKELKLKWGDFKDEDYEFLESKYKEYTDSFGVAGPNERDGYQVLATLLLKQRETPMNKDIIAAIKAQYEMLGIDPRQIRKDNKDKGARTLGIEIATMEKYEPAEYYKDKKMYFDHDGLEKDIQDLKRAQKNHLTGSKDFNNFNIDTSIDDDIN